MAPNWTRLFHVACCCCILAASLVLADQFDTRRQVSRPKGQQAPANNRPVSATSMAMAPANDDELEEDRARPKAEMRPDGSGESTDKEEPMSQDDEQPARGDPESRRPAKRPMDRSRHENEDEDCYDGEDYADYGSHFFEPMRHFSNMMDSVFQQMSGYGMNRQIPMGGQSVASSASAFVGDDGYSKLSSSVTNNGRTRGVVSETRNGRTQTRRIGRDDEGSEEY